MEHPSPPPPHPHPQLIGSSKHHQPWLFLITRLPWVFVTETV